MKFSAGTCEKNWTNWLRNYKGAKRLQSRDQKLSQQRMKYLDGTLDFVDSATDDGSCNPKRQELKFDQELADTEDQASSKINKDVEGSAKDACDMEKNTNVGWSSQVNKVVESGMESEGVNEQKLIHTEDMYSDSDTETAFETSSESDDEPLINIKKVKDGSYSGTVTKNRNIANENFSNVIETSQMDISKRSQHEESGSEDINKTEEVFLSATDMSLMVAETATATDDPIKDVLCLSELETDTTVIETVELSSESESELTNNAASAAKPMPQVTYLLERRSYSDKGDTPNKVKFDQNDIDDLIKAREKDDSNVDQTTLKYLINLASYRVKQTLNCDFDQDAFDLPTESSVIDKTVGHSSIAHSDQSAKLASANQTITVGSLMDTVITANVAQQESFKVSDINVSTCGWVTSNLPFKMLEATPDRNVTVGPHIDLTSSEANEDADADVDFDTVYELHRRTENTGVFFKKLCRYIEQVFPPDNQNLLRLKICSIITEAELETMGGK